MKEEVYNPYLPGWEYIADGEPHIFGDRLYIFGSHDRAGGSDYCMNDYVGWSTPLTDLSEWKYEGIVYPRTAHPHEGDLPFYFAPDVAQGLDGRYYLYYSVKDSSILSVAVCDTPVGRYEYLGDVHFQDGRVLGASPDDWYQFDPSVLVDIDGRIWLYSGSGQELNMEHGHPVMGCLVMELESDMLTIRKGPKQILPAKESLEEPNFFEGASARHIGEWYYLIYPATNLTGLNYAMSRYPDRDFEHKGIIHCTSDIGYEGRGIGQLRYPVGNYHGGLVCIEGQWYIFDHRQTNRTFFSRQGVAERIHINDDGTIDMVETTSCGLNGGPLCGKGEYPAYIACNLMGETVDGNRDPFGGPYITQDEPDYEPEKGGIEPVPYVAGIANGCVVGYKYFNLQGITNTKLSIRGKAAGTIDILVEEEGAVLGKLDIQLDCELWETVEIPVAELNGISAVYIRFEGKGSFSLKTVEFGK